MKAEQHNLDVEKILQNFPTRLGRIKSYGKRPWPLIEQDSIAKRQSSSHLGDNLLHSVSLLDHMMKWERTTRQLERMRSDDGPFQFSFLPNQLFNDNHMIIKLMINMKTKSHKIIIANLSLSSSYNTCQSYYSL
ncbi:hypothetical protein T10_4697 [Trichinella papuae]|uniref:Uncharacterized protein n=1 Tax=Trichinella papuae TaxID=268474 RepID=A0A0V1MA06_9BILA|nr:hypothetical protein T10_4697 [Trichinella papuae]